MQADEAARRYEEQSKAEISGRQATPRFEAKDLESLTGSYHTVCCIDVLIHYPPVRLSKPTSAFTDHTPFLDWPNLLQAVLSGACCTNLSLHQSLRCLPCVPFPPLRS